MQNKLVRILGAGFLLLLLGAGLVLWKLDPILESFRPEIEKLLSKQLKQPVSIGKLSLKIFPSATARVSELRIHDSSASPAAKELVLKIGLLPLLSKRLEISEVGLEGAKLDVLRKSGGELQVNGVPLGATSENDTAAESQQGDSSAKKSIEVDVKKAWIKDSELRWRDESVSPAQDVGISHASLALQGIRGNSVSAFEASAQVLSNSANNFSLSGNVEGGAGKANVKLRELDLKKLGSLIAAYSKKPLPLTLGETADLEGEISFSPGAFLLRGGLEGKGADIHLGEFFVKPKGDELSVNLAGQANLLGKVELSELRAVIGKNKIDAPLSGDALGNGNVHIKSTALSLETLSHYLPILARYQVGGALDIDLGIEILGRALKGLNGFVAFNDVAANVSPEMKSETPVVSALKGKIDFSGDNLEAKSLSLLLAGQPVELTSRVRSLSTPEVDLAVHMNSLKPGPLLKAFTGTANPSLEDSLLEGLDLALNYSVPKKVSTITLETSGGSLASFPISKTKLNLDAQLSAKNELLRGTLQPSTISLFGGNATVNGSLNESSQLSLAAQAGGIDLKQLCAVATPGSKISLIGTLKSMTFKASGPKQNFAGALIGSLEANAVKGAIVGFNLLAQTLGKIDQIPGLGAALLEFIPENRRWIVQSDSTSFDDLSLQAQMSGKDIKLTNFTLTHELYVLTGRGTIPANGELNIEAQLKLTEALAKGMVLKQPKLKLLLDKNNSIVFPVIITRKGGVLLVFPDVSNLGKRALENTARDAATKALDKVSPGLGGALNSLFK